MSYAGCLPSIFSSARMAGINERFISNAATLGAQPQQRKHFGKLDQAFSLFAFANGQRAALVLFGEQFLQAIIDAFRQFELL